MAQTNMYADFTGAASGGLKDGTSKANAWTTWAEVIAGEAPGDNVNFRTHSEVRTTVVTPSATGTAALPILWRVIDWSTDAVVDSSSWEGYGGSLGFTSDRTGAGANQDGILLNAGGIRHLRGFTILEATRMGFYAFNSKGNMDFCKSYSATSKGVSHDTATTRMGNCIFENEAVGASGGAALFINCTFINCTIGGGAYTASVTFLNCLFINCTTAISGYVIYIKNCAFYNNTTHIVSGNATNGIMVEDSVFEGGTTLFNISSSGRSVFAKNVKYFNVTYLSGGNDDNLIDLGGNELLGSSPFVDAAGGDYRSDSTVTELYNISSKLNNTGTIEYRQAGLIQEVSAGGGVAQLVNGGLIGV